MGTAVLISIKPEWCRKIASGEKTIEVRKTRPKLETPFKCYIYETKGKTDTPWMDEDGHIDFHGCGMVIGEFVCDRIIDWQDNAPPPVPLKDTCLTYGALRHYGGTTETLFLWHISELKIYDKPKRITEFHSPCEPCVCHSTEKGCTNDFACLHSIERPPQSWCYVAEH